MYQFNYQRPKSLADAEALLAAADDPKILAGGQTLIPTLKQRLAMPSDLIDIGAIKELDFIRAEGNAVTIGAATRHATVAQSADVRKHNPALAALAGGIGDPAVRHMGTLGGSFANNDPAADYPAACLALDAKIHTTKRL
ncbi:MAG: FAD binding domain-containing protein, partial [Pseudomonadota bacterium]